MKVELNGEPKEVGEGTLLRELLEETGVDPEGKGIAAAVNGEIVARESWGTRELSEGDRVDVIHAVQGG